MNEHQNMDIRTKHEEYKDKTAVQKTHLKGSHGESQIWLNGKAIP